MHIGSVHAKGIHLIPWNIMENHFLYRTLSECLRLAVIFTKFYSIEYLTLKRKKGINVMPVHTHIVFIVLKQ